MNCKLFLLIGLAIGLLAGGVGGYSARNCNGDQAVAKNKPDEKATPAQELDEKARRAQEKARLEAETGVIDGNDPGVTIHYK